MVRAIILAQLLAAGAFICPNPSDFELTKERPGSSFGFYSRLTISGLLFGFAGYIAVGGAKDDKNN